MYHKEVIQAWPILAYATPTGAVAVAVAPNLLIDPSHQTEDTASVASSESTESAESIDSAESTEIARKVRTVPCE